MPGEGIVDIAKYGLGKNINYDIIVDPYSRINYTSTINKYS